MRWLIDRRQKSIGVHRHSSFLCAVWIGHYDITRQRFRFAAKPVHCPRSHARKTRNHTSGEQLILRSRMHDHIAVNGTNNRQIVDTLREIWEQIRNLNATFAVAFEGPLRAEQFCIRRNKLILRFTKTRGPFLSIQFVQQRLRIKCFHVTWATAEKEKNHRFRFRRMMRLLRCERIERLRPRLFRGEHCAKSESAKTTKSV